MKKLYTLLLILSLSGLSFAQKIIKGIVTDFGNKPIPAASVTVYNAENKIVTFKTTNPKGEFSLSVPKEGKYTLKIKHIKFEEYTEEVELNENDTETELAINLTGKDESTLKEVIVKGKSSDAKISGDTITFKIEKFLDKTERTLGDILNKLPGIEVDEQGNINANGKRIDKLLVEGQDFFSDSHKMATENITSDAVKDVQLLTDFKERGKLSEMNGQRQVALNVNLKDEYKGKITGDIEAAGGYEDKYDIHTNLFRFTRSGNAAMIADAQNTGAQVLQFSDFVAFMGGASEMFSMGRGMRFNTNFGSNSVAALINSSNNVESRLNQMAAANINQKLSKSTRLKLTNIGSHSTTVTFRETLRNYTQTGDIEKITDRSKEDIFFNFTRMGLEYQPNDSTLIRYNMSFNYSDTDISNQNQNTLNNITNSFESFTKSKDYQFTHGVNYETKPKARTIVGFSLAQEVQNTPSNNRLFSSTPFLFLPTNPDDYYESLYNQENNKQVLSAAFYYKYSRRKKIYKVEMGYRRNALKLDTDFFQFFADGSSTLFQPQFFTNRINYSRDDLYADISVSKNKGFWQFEVGSVFKNIQMQHKDEFDAFNINRIYPYAEVSMNFNTAHVLTFNYEFSDNFPSIQNYSEGQFINSYQSITVRESIPLSTIFPNHQLSLNYRYFNQFSGWSFFIGTNFSYQDEFLTTNSVPVFFSNTIINLIERQIAPYNQSLTGFGNVRKKFNKIPITARIGGNINKSQSFSFILGDQRDVQTLFYSTNFSLETNFKKPFFNIETGIRYSQTFNEIEGNPRQELSNYAPFFEIHGAFEMGLKYETRLTYRVFEAFQKTEFYDLNSTISYAGKDSKWEFTLTANNALNFDNQEQLTTSLNNGILSETRTRILPGFILLGAKYKFK